MKKRSPLHLLIFAIGITMVSACGGGASSSSPQPSGPTTAVIRIETTGVLGPGVMIGGITVTGVLPAGVTVKTTPDPQNPSVLVTDTDVVIASGVTGTNAGTIATYDAAERKVSIYVWDAVDGFGTGEFVTVRCTIASGATPTSGGFGLSDLSVYDLDGADIIGLAAGYTAEIQ